MRSELTAIFSSLASRTPNAPQHKDANSLGVVTAAGGLTLTVNAWLVCTRLRELGCSLPIELFHAAHEEMPFAVRQAFPRDVTFRQIGDDAPGYAMKPRALWASHFDRCLWIDADNLPLCDPSSLVRATGPARFWPDAFRTTNPEILAAMNCPHSPLELESGQMVIPTRDNARALWIACQLNEAHRAIIYRYVNGDKDTFRIAWALAGAQAETVARLPLVVGHESTRLPLWPLSTELKLRFSGARRRHVGLIQHDLNGQPLFLHRTVREWSLYDPADTLTWIERVDEQVSNPRDEWSPRAPEPVPRVVSEAFQWARNKLTEIEWFPAAFGIAMPERAWLKSRFSVEAALAAVLRPLYRSLR